MHIFHTLSRNQKFVLTRLYYMYKFLHLISLLHEIFNCMNKKEVSLLYTFVIDYVSYPPHVSHLMHFFYNFSLRDLHGNHIEVLNSEALIDLENLMELRLHTQNPKMTTLMFNSMINVGKSLRYL